MILKKLIGPPAQPVIMVGVNYPNSIHIVWNSASDIVCGLVTYHIELRFTANETLIKQDTTNNLMYTFTGLSPGTHYTAYVYGNNQAGDGDTASLPVMTASSSTSTNGDDNGKDSELVYIKYF